MCKLIDIAMLYTFQQCLDLFQVDIALLILTLLVFIHPIYVFIYCRRAANDRANKMPSNAAQDLKSARVNSVFY